MIHPHTQLRHVNPEIGIGVYATHLIPKGTIVYVKDPLEIEIGPAQFWQLDAMTLTLADKYAYIDARGIRIVSWDHGKYVNHRCECNTMSTGYGFEIALRDIAPGEEMTDEYDLFNIAEPLRVSCGCPAGVRTAEKWSCRQTLTAAGPYGMSRFGMLCTILWMYPSPCGN